MASFSKLPSKPLFQHACRHTYNEHTCRHTYNKPKLFGHAGLGEHAHAHASCLVNSSAYAAWYSPYTLYHYDLYQHHSKAAVPGLRRSCGFALPTACGAICKHPSIRTIKLCCRTTHPSMYTRAVVSNLLASLRGTLRRGLLLSVPGSRDGPRPGWPGMRSILPK